MSFLYQAGGQLLDNTLTKPAINSPQARRALEWTVKLHREGLAAPGVIEGTEDPLLIFFRLVHPVAGYRQLDDGRVGTPDEIQIRIYLPAEGCATGNRGGRSQ